MSKVIRPLWSHQKRVVEKVINERRNYFALFHDMGAGKSKTIIHVFREYCSLEKRLLKCLIITPLATIHNWQREIVALEFPDSSRLSTSDVLTQI